MLYNISDFYPDVFCWDKIGELCFHIHELIKIINCMKKALEDQQQRLLFKADDVYNQVIQEQISCKALWCSPALVDAAQDMLD